MKPVRLVLMFVAAQALFAVIVSPTYFSFTYQHGGQLPATKNITITGGSRYTVQVATNPAGWLDVSPQSGSIPAVLQVRVLPGGLAANTYVGIITITDPDATFYRTETITVNLTVTGTPTTATPELLRFAAVAPCRVVDTRQGEGKTYPFGPPTMAAGSTRAIPIPQGSCDIPNNAKAYSVNVTVVPAGPLSYLTLWPTGKPQPLASTLNSFEGRIVANGAIVPAGSDGAVSVYVTDKTDVIIDINGYFLP